jgi:pyocin large subunit-like protein
MSMHALRWAYPQKIKPSSRKSVFLNLAYHYNDDLNQAWPSVALICEETSLDRDTVILALDDLEAQKRIEDTGQRKGLTRSVKVYRFVGFVVSSRENGTAKQSEFSGKQSGFFPRQSEVSPENTQNQQRNGGSSLESLKSSELKFLRTRLIQQRNSGKLDTTRRAETRGQLVQIKEILAQRGIQYAASL